MAGCRRAGANRRANGRRLPDADVNTGVGSSQVGTFIEEGAILNISARSALIAGVATVTASAVLIAPSVQPLPPPRPAIQLAADVQLTAQPADYFSQLGSWWQPIFWPSASRSFPPPPDIGPSPTPTGFEDAIIGTYYAIEPWVRWGFEIATYAVGFIPWVGWLSGQIMIFYNFGERIVESLVVNSANWLWGPLPFLEGLGNIAWDSWDALVQLGRDELNFFLPSLPPLPPLPCIFRCNNLSELNAPLDAIRVGLRDTVDALLQQLLHGPDELLPGVTTDIVQGFTTKGSDPLAEVSRVPERVINFLNPATAAQDEVAGTVPDVQPGPKKPRLDPTSLIEAPGNIIKGAVQAQGEVRSAAAGTTANDSQSTVGRARGPFGEAVTNTANTVTKRVTETARDVVSTIKKASDDTRTSVKNGNDNTHTSVKKGKSDDE